MSIGWRRCARTLASTHATIPHAIATLLHGLLKLLLLRIGHQRFQLLMSLHHCIAHLGAALLGAQIRIVAERLHPFVLVLQDGQHLLLLIGGQVQHIRQMTQLMLGAWRMMMPHASHGPHGLRARVGLLTCRALRGRSRGLRKHRRGNTKCHSENSKSPAHSSEKFTRIHLESFLQDTRRTATELMGVNCGRTVCSCRR